MAESELTRSEALALITPIVDGEATQQEEVAFYNYAHKDPSVLKKMEKERQLKQLIKSKCKRAAAPPQLREWLLRGKYCNQNTSYDTADSLHITDPNWVNTSDNQHRQTDSGDIVLHPNPLFNLQQRTWVYTVMAAAILLIIIYGYSISWQVPTGQQQFAFTTASINISHQTYKHFSDRAFDVLAPTYTTQEIDAATNWINDHLKLGVHVPKIDNTTLKGVYISDFDNEYQTPLLEYLTTDGQAIYLFVFNEKQLNKTDHLTRTPEAVKACSTKTNYYIENIRGKHVVSWKWDDNWYTAISNLEGQSLANKIKPLAH